MPRQIGSALRVGAGAEQPLGLCARLPWQMDGATTADKARLERLAAEKRARVQNSVRLGITVEWTSLDYINSWADLVVKRNKLEPQVPLAESTPTRPALPLRLSGRLHSNSAPPARLP